MNFDKYLCNLKQSYLALIMTSTINHIIENAPSMYNSGNFYTAFWVDENQGSGMLKVIIINTALKQEINIFGITELDVFLTGATFYPLKFNYKYNEMNETFTIGYEVML